MSLSTKEVIFVVAGTFVGVPLLAAIVAPAMDVFTIILLWLVITPLFLAGFYIVHFTRRKRRGFPVELPQKRSKA